MVNTKEQNIMVLKKITSMCDTMLGVSVSPTDQIKLDVILNKMSNIEILERIDAAEVIYKEIFLMSEKSN